MHLLPMETDRYRSIPVSIAYSGGQQEPGQCLCHHLLPENLGIAAFPLMTLGLLSSYANLPPAHMQVGWGGNPQHLL